MCANALREAPCRSRIVLMRRSAVNWPWVTLHAHEEPRLADMHAGESATRCAGQARFDSTITLRNSFDSIKCGRMRCGAQLLNVCVNATEIAAPCSRACLKAFVAEHNTTLRSLIVTSTQSLCARSGSRCRSPRTVRGRAPVADAVRHPRPIAVRLRPWECAMPHAHPMASSCTAPPDRR